MLAIAELEGNWMFSGAGQVKALMEWNNTTMFHSKYKSKKWATEDISRLWMMQRIADKAAAEEHTWLELVGDPTVAIPAKRKTSAECNEFVDEDDHEPELGLPSSNNNIPAWMRADMIDMSIDLDEDDEETSPIRTGALHLADMAAGSAAAPTTPQTAESKPAAAQHDAAATTETLPDVLVEKTCPC